MAISLAQPLSRAMRRLMNEGEWMLSTRSQVSIEPLDNSRTPAEAGAHVCRGMDSAFAGKTKGDGMTGNPHLVINDEH